VVLPTEKEVVTGSDISVRESALARKRRRRMKIKSMKRSKRKIKSKSMTELLAASESYS
jgi:hypothetical protein